MMNVFTYIKGADPTIRRQIDEWDAKAKEYLVSLYEGDIERAKGTKFGDCISKIESLLDMIITDSENFRGVTDTDNRLQAGAIIENRSDYLYIDIFTNSPWNVVKNQPETKAGAATSLVEGIVRESIELGQNGIIKANILRRAIPFYEKIGFVEENGSGEFMLTETASRNFLITQASRQ
ncbi:hypothetical protein RIVM261_029810 [Rivularia sp. IAM M-261]|nr:hypothetical protein RIVM261_029810 [Rivularia sp. IAM M-261]